MAEEDPCTLETVYNDLNILLRLHLAAQQACRCAALRTLSLACGRTSSTLGGSLSLSLQHMDCIGDLQAKEQLQGRLTFSGEI